jgi:hypothetical protein
VAARGAAFLHCLAFLIRDRSVSIHFRVRIGGFWKKPRETTDRAIRASQMLCQFNL